MMATFSGNIDPTMQGFLVPLAERIVLFGYSVIAGTAGAATPVATLQGFLEPIAKRLSLFGWEVHT